VIIFYSVQFLYIKKRKQTEFKKKNKPKPVQTNWFWFCFLRTKTGSNWFGSVFSGLAQFFLFSAVLARFFRFGFGFGLVFLVSGL
jgi:hypothetical protein